MYRPLALALFLTACTGGTDKETGSANGGDATAGATVFTNTCATCHAADGTGGAGPDITGVVPTLSDAELESIIVDGKGSMAAVALDEQELADVMAYLRQEFGG